MQSIKVRRVILICAVSLALAGTTLATYTGVSRSRTVSTTLPAVYNYKYVVSEYDGHVAVFVPGQQMPSYITDTPVSALPFADREMLARGIEVKTEAELSSLLEDYGP